MRVTTNRYQVPTYLHPNSGDRYAMFVLGNCMDGEKIFSADVDLEKWYLP